MIDRFVSTAMPVVFRVCLMVLLLPGTLTAGKVGQPAPETGHTIPLEDHPSLHLSVQENQLSAHFLDADGNIVPPPAKSIIFVVDDSGHRNDEFRTVLRPAEDASLTSPRRLFPPYEFRIRLIIRLPGDQSILKSNLKVDLAAASS